MMVGNRVRIVQSSSSVEGVLKNLDAAGAIISIEIEGIMPELLWHRFIPMNRIVEIVDLGRAP